MRTYVRLGLSACLMAHGAAVPAHAQETWQGVTRPRVLTAFDPSRPVCKAPEGRTRELVFAQDNDRQFMQGIGAGLAAAARDRKLDFRIEAAANDAVRMVRQVDTARQSNVGTLVAAPINAVTLAPALKALIRDGAYVGTIVPPPAVTILNAPQFMTGEVLAKAASAYIRQKLGGQARVVLLTHDSNQFLSQRFVAMRQALKKLPGVTIVADISPLTVNKQGGYETMQKVLIAYSRVDVVLGADTVVLGALKAVREAGLNRADQFFGGIDGEPEAIGEIKKGGEYKATVSLAGPVFAYAMGQHAADWLEGKSIPQAMDILPTLLTSSNIGQYEADVANPAAVWQSPEMRASYLRMYGNICYETRDQFLNFAWSSESKPADGK